jgi:hypothetical protein
MSKFSVFIATDGLRDEMVSYFANNGVLYLYPVERFISTDTLPADSSDADVCETGEALARTLVHLVDEMFDEVDDTYPFTDKHGKSLGWEVVVYTTEWEDVQESDSFYGD